MPRITLSQPADMAAGGPAALGARWQALQARADGSFFQSWSWVGCRARERFPDPLLLEAEADGRTVALALFNRRRPWFRRERLFLGESGISALDDIYVEHNGPLIERGAEHLLAPLLRAALAASGRMLLGRRLVLSGVDAAVLAGVGPVRARRQPQPAPFVDLAAIRAGGGDYLAGLSANARYQLRRSDRRYGTLALRRADTVAEAHDFLDALAALHQAYWTRRGRPGAFANPGFHRFHRSLIERALPAGEVDLLRITAGAEVLGYLYNFRFRGTVSAYQSGFDYAAAGPQQKPGLTCHHLAIEQALADGADRYDFLAGADRYKRSLGNGETTLHWVETR